MDSFLLVTAIMVLGATLQASVGYGYGLVVVPMLLLVEPTFVPVPYLLASIFLMSVVSFKNRHSLQEHFISPLLLGLAVGAPVGVAFLTVIAPKTMMLLVAILVLLGLLLSLIKVRIEVTRLSQFIAGVFSNIAGVTTGLGSVPVALLYQKGVVPLMRSLISGFQQVTDSTTEVAQAHYS